MPARRLKTAILLLAISVLVLFYITTGASSTKSSEFYTRTVAAMNAAAAAKSTPAPAAVPHSSTQQVKAALNGGDDIAEANAHAKADRDGAGRDAEVDNERAKKGTAKGSTDEDLELNVPGVGKVKAGGQEPLAADVKGAAAAAGDKIVEGVHGPGEKSVAGRKKVPGANGVNDKVVEAPVGGGDGKDGVAKVGNTGGKVVQDKTKSGKGDVDEGTGPQSKEDHEVEVELDSILKKSPIIIFSKSYCPFSRKAKHYLLDAYKIVPAPYVEELDHHKLGSKLQAALEKSTGRKTVPNVLINGKSIGGGDDIEALDHDGKLADKIREMGGKRIMEVSKVSK